MAKNTYARILTGVPLLFGTLAFTAGGLAALRSHSSEVAAIGLIIAGLLAIATIGIWRQADDTDPDLS
ncbi:hypothetical protein [Synechococcus elongatus]|uniref:Uncharacterized protein n=1 Tax=Synechococcus elongatus (strain ATCC 33912 / PCC 7942 / FACHB-805) TaxID=1140 RepID=Q31L85_SYNE7|nr:hypothetical protein [Synechococcus elongatus]ABB58184.1 hypothetical protein Synpcc7942_2154 [Synechococcus elongatus PCC 7942 = FACHB-805]AJD58876.1 hypothetical protein M744_05585 [Synechococcus elongatus UTEX 2973]MBD2586907.1 hypothetical protein [Synechococcus elongatus FACHB-242]MBD2687978.1 hypothetical protein [Synechococcus elongatus FACHB-1061]MBD2706311.1 hypothetical protein [Synechococcus elongatus PCC 7942 = FACHB-805]